MDSELSNQANEETLSQNSKKDVIWDKKKKLTSDVASTFFKFEQLVYENDIEGVKKVISDYEEDKARRESLLIETFKRGSILSSCGENLVFAINTDTNNEFIHRLIKAEFCKFKYCPICTWRKSLKLKALFMSRIDGVISENPNLTYLFLTLTMKNDDVEKIKEMLDTLNESFRKITRQKFYKKTVKGHIKTIEITRSKTGEAHPHLHILLAVTKDYFGTHYKSTKEWGEIWKGALGVDYDPIIDIRKVYDKKGKGGVKSSVAEALKYSVKGTDLRDMKFLINLTLHTKGKRFIAASGIFKGIFRKEEFTDEELIKITDEDSEEIKPEDIRAYTFRQNFKKYLRNFTLEAEEREMLENESTVAYGEWFD